MRLHKRFGFVAFMGVTVVAVLLNGCAFIKPVNVDVAFENNEVYIDPGTPDPSSATVKMKVTNYSNVRVYLTGIKADYSDFRGGVNGYEDRDDDVGDNPTLELKLNQLIAPARDSRVGEETALENAIIPGRLAELAAAYVINSCKGQFKMTFTDENGVTQSVTKSIAVFFYATAEVYIEIDTQSWDFFGAQDVYQLKITDSSLTDQSTLSPINVDVYLYNDDRTEVAYYETSGSDWNNVGGSQSFVFHGDDDGDVAGVVAGKAFVKTSDPPDVTNREASHVAVEYKDIFYDSAFPPMN